MYGKYKGTLMITMGCDGNNQLFPFALPLQKVKIRIVGVGFWHV